MKKIFNQLFVWMSAVLMLASCSPDDINLGLKDVKPEDLEEGIAYTIEMDAEIPNLVHLKSKMGNTYTPLWNHPQGRSQSHEVTLRIPFAGTYEVEFGVMTRGGAVYGQKATFTLDQMNTDFIKDELWTLLSGGVGQSKTWVLDLFPKDEAPAFCKQFVGPMYFYGTADSWLTVTEGQTVAGDSWNWKADWAGNGSWLFGSETQLDYGTMTFDLIDGAHLTVDHKILGKQQAGTYLLDTENKTMRTVDAQILHDAGREGIVLDWGNIKVMSLTENYMQLAVLRDPVLSGEGACLLVYNFISKGFSDNWIPGEVPEPEPTLPDGWQDDVTVDVSYIKKWVLSPETPFNWFNLDGTSMNSGWTSPATYPDWTGFNATVPATYADFSLTFNSKTNAVDFVTPDGTEQSGTYTLDEKGVYIFDGVKPAFNICSWVNLSTTAENQWRIVKIDKDATGAIKGMWVGARDPEKPEYMAYYLVPKSGGGAVDPISTIKSAICAKTWKLDADRTYDVATSWGAEQGPVIFSDYSSWSWNPKPGEHYAAGEASIDYGTMKFAKNGTVTVSQFKRVYTYVDETDGLTKTRNGLPAVGDVMASEETLALSGTWSYDDETKAVSLSVGMLHPWTSDYMAANWGATTLYKVTDNVLILQVTRSLELSGEGEMPIAYVFVPAQ